MFVGNSSRICQIKFFRTATRTSESDEGPSTKKRAEIIPASDAQFSIFLDTINVVKQKPVTLKITPPYAKDLVPALSLPTYPTPIMELYNPTALHFPYHDLLVEGETVLGSIKVCTYLIIVCALTPYHNRFHQTKWRIWSK